MCLVSAFTEQREADSDPPPHRFEPQEDDQLSRVPAFWPEQQRQPRSLHKTHSDTSRYLPQQPLFVSQLPREILSETAEVFVISAKVSAVPAAVFRWTVNGFEVKSTPKTTILYEKNCSTLVVQPPVKLGKYSVTATNENGSSSLSTRVVSLSKPEPVTEEARIHGRPLSGELPDFVQKSITITSPLPREKVEDENVMSRNSSVETVKRRVFPSLTAGAASSSSSTELPSRENLLVDSTLHADDSPKVTFRKSKIESCGLPRTPRIIQGLPEHGCSLLSGERLVLIFKVDSIPESSFQWFINNFEVKNSSTVCIVCSNGNQSTATFVRPTDGLYRVTATNQLGSINSITRVKVTGGAVEESAPIQKTVLKSEPVVFKLVRRKTSEGRTDFPKKPRIIEPLPSVFHVTASQPLHLSVEADAIPRAKFTWRYNNFELKSGPKIVLQTPSENKTVAHFYSPSSGRYEVVAMNELGQDSTSSKVIVELPVTEKKLNIRSGTAPVWVKALSPEAIRGEGQKPLQFDVLVEGTLPMAFRWFINMHEVKDSHGIRITTDGGHSHLSLEWNSPEDAQVVVEASNRLGAVRSSTELRIKAFKERNCEFPIWAKDLPERVEVDAGQELTLGVGIEKEALPCNFSWTIGEISANDKDKVFVDSTEHESLLTIIAAAEELSGTLRVTASNYAGEASSTTTLNVRASECMASLLFFNPVFRKYHNINCLLMLRPFCLLLPSKLERKRR